VHACDQKAHHGDPDDDIQDPVSYTHLDVYKRQALVAEALVRHGIPKVGPGGPIWQRFPSPLSLTPAMVRELYVTCGLSTRQIELLTGQPSDTVGHRLRDIGVPLRSKEDGRSPFLKRWRAVEGQEPALAKGPPPGDGRSARRH